MPATCLTRPLEPEFQSFQPANVQTRSPFSSDGAVQIRDMGAASIASSADLCFN